MHAGVMPIAARPAGSWVPLSLGVATVPPSGAFIAVKASWSADTEVQVPVASVLPLLLLLLPPVSVDPPPLLWEQRVLQDTSLSGASEPLKA